MIIIIKGADFSANNLGKIEDAYSPKTKSILEKYNNASLSKEQEKTLDNLIIELTGSGILAKINKLYLPILADNLEKSMLDIKSEVFDVIPSNESFSLNKGIVKNNVDNALNIDVDFSNCSSNDFHYLSYPTQKIVGAYDWINPLSVNGQTQVTTQLTSGRLVLATNQCKLFGVTLFTSATYRIVLENATDFKGISLVNGNGYYALHNGVVDYKSVNIDNAVGAINKLNLCAYQNRSMNVPHAVISFGQGLTENELLTYNELIKSLVDSF